MCCFLAKIDRKGWGRRSTSIVMVGHHGKFASTMAGCIDSICFLHLVADDDDVDMTLVRRYLPEHIIAFATY